MKTLLARAQQRQIAIFEYLVQHHWVHLQTLSHELGFPQRTIISDISEINQLASPIEIVSSSRGVKLVCPINYAPRYFYRKILEKSREYQILETIFFEKVPTLDALAENLFLSLSTIKRLISNMNKELKSRNFQIKMHPLHLEGDEKEIIHFFTFYFMEKYYYQRWLFSPRQQTLIDQLTASVFETLHLDKNGPSFKRTIYWAYAHLIRLKNNHPFVPVTSEVTYEWSILKDTAFVTQFQKVFHLPLTEEHIIVCYSRFIDATYIYDEQNLVPIFQTQPHLKELYCKLEKLLHNLEREFKITLEKPQPLLFTLYRLMTVRHTPSYIIYPRRKYFLLGVSGNYRVITRILRKELNEVFQNQWSEDELDELTYILFTHWPNLIPKIRDYLPIIPIGIYLDTDIEHGMLLKSELIQRSHLRLDIKIVDILDEKTYQEIQRDEVILITNLPQLPIPHPYTLCIAEMPAEWQWKEIHELQNDYVERHVP